MACCVRSHPDPDSGGERGVYVCVCGYKALPSVRQSGSRRHSLPSDSRAPKYYRLENPAEETGIGVECTLRHSRHHTTFQPGENAAHIPHWKDLQPVNTSCGQAGETRLINNAEWAVPVPEPATEYLQSEWNLPEDKAAILTEMIAEYLESDDAPHAQSRTRLTITSDGSHREHQQIGTFAWAIKPDGQGCDQPSQADFEYFTFADGGGEHATPFPEIGDPSP